MGGFSRWRIWQWKGLATGKDGQMRGRSWTGTGKTMTQPQVDFTVGKDGQGQGQG